MIQRRCAEREARNVFRKYDAGDGKRSQHEKDGDCQCRALTTACELEYNDAYDLLYRLQGKCRTHGFALLKFIELEPATFGMVRKLPFPAQKGKPRMTAERFVKLYPNGRFVLQLAHHPGGRCGRPFIRHLELFGKMHL